MTEMLTRLTNKEDKSACMLADRIVSESRDTDQWYPYLEDFAVLLRHPKSLVRNRALHILACFHDADLSQYKDSMRPLIERDMAETEKALMELQERTP